MKRSLAIFLLILLSFVSYGQDPAYLKQHAIKIENQDSLTNDICKTLCSYKLIMIGEMHGSNEPARFVIGLANLQVKHNDHVQTGLEIPSGQMKRYLSNPVDSNIYKSDFFSGKSMDARGCFAWADIISKLKNNSKIEIFFYDVNWGDSSHYSDTKMNYSGICFTRKVTPSNLVSKK